MKRIVCACVLTLALIWFSACGTVDPENSPALTDDSRDVRILELEAQIEDLSAQIEELKNHNENDELAEAFRLAALVWENDNAALVWEAGEPEYRLWLTLENAQRYLSYNAEPFSVPFETGTLLEAHAALSLKDELTGEEEIWLLVEYPIYSIPAQPVIWVRASECVPYTDEKRFDVCYPVCLREGADLYFREDTADTGASDLVSGQMAGSLFFIIRIEDGWAFVGSDGGYQARVAEGDIVWPDPSSFTYD